MGSSLFLVDLLSEVVAAHNQLAVGLDQGHPRILDHQARREAPVHGTVGMQANQVAPPSTIEDSEPPQPNQPPVRLQDRPLEFSSRRRGFLAIHLEPQMDTDGRRWARRPGASGGERGGHDPVRRPCRGRSSLGLRICVHLRPSAVSRPHCHRYGVQLVRTTR